MCVSMNVWHAYTILVCFFRKDWACSVLEMSSCTCGGIVTMETVMEMMFELKETQDLLVLQIRKTAEGALKHNVFLLKFKIQEDTE